MNFCTYYDSYYLYKGLALYFSLAKVTTDFHLYVMAFDQECYDKLNSLHLDNLTVELFSDVETEELKAVKGSRTRGEYCWTCGPYIISHFLKSFGLDGITYLDSDLFFLTDPHIIQQEIGTSSIAITEQGIGEKHAKVYGRYCVQYMFFRNDDDGLSCLDWWQHKCLDWCYARIEDGKFGDQKYLDEFPERWNSVCVIKNLGAGIAPWNEQRYLYTDSTISYNGQSYPFVFVHMHGFAMNISKGNLILENQHFLVSDNAKALFYNPYAELVIEILRKYFNINIDTYKVVGVSKLKHLNHLFRGQVRDNKLIRWLYYNLFSQKYKGHGTKL